MKHPSIVQTEIKMIQESVIWHDVLEVMQVIEKRPLKLTQKNNLTRKEIEHFVQVFKYDLYKYRRDKKGEIEYPFRCENESWYLLKIRALIDVMKLGRCYKHSYRITKEGKQFLKLSSSDQFVLIFNSFVLTYNWEYTHPSFGREKPVAIILQQNFIKVFERICETKGEWCDFKPWAKMIAQELDLLIDHPLYPSQNDFVLNDIGRIIIEELRQFNLLETEVKVDRFKFETIIRFKLNKLGLGILKQRIPDFEQMPGLKPVNITIKYEGAISSIIETSSESVVVSENVPFVFVLKSIFDSHPEIEPNFPPGSLSLLINDHMPDEFETLRGGDVITLTTADKLPN